MKIILFVLCFIQPALSFCQVKPHVVKEYIDKGEFLINSLTLVSDGYYFTRSSCECNKEYLSKGKWTIRKNKLILNSLPEDSFDLYPTFKFIRSDKRNDSVTIKAVNYFKQPLKIAISALPVANKTTAEINEQRLELDEFGILKLSRNEFYGFMMEYERHRNDLKVGEPMGVYFDDEYLDTVEIFADVYIAGYDAELVKEHPQKNLTYIIKGSTLLFKNGKIAYVVK